MLSFELSAIDLILSLAVIVLLAIYLTKISKQPDLETFNKIRKKFSLSQRNNFGLSTQTTVPDSKKSIDQSIKTTKCPRGFGDIKKFNDDNSVSERCLNCHLIIDCFSEKN